MDNMNKNIKLLFCILGSTFLVLLKSDIFESAKLALFEGRGYGSSLFGELIYSISNILSFIGFVLVIIFSIILIVININFRNK